jgi:hypothetical protein
LSSFADLGPIVDPFPVRLRGQVLAPNGTQIPDQRVARARNVPGADITIGMLT